MNDEQFETRAQARREIVEYIGYYITERRHSSLDYVRPGEFEQRWRVGSNPMSKALSR